MSDTTSASPGGDAHDEHHVHTYEFSGIQEGNARVPRWLLAVIIALFGFFVWYVVSQREAQPSAAKAKER
jgi:hypothetical protein